MAENSFYFAGTTDGDAGPYTETTMYKVLAQIARAGNAESLSALYNFGVFYAIANNLEPTINGTNIDVDTGGSLIDGLYHENDATVSVAIPTAAAGNERKDYIVVRKNYQQAVTYTPGGGAPTVPPRTARITVIRGSECVSPCAPATPTLTQDTTRATYWDIPIATVEVNDAGVLSSLVDTREFVDAETKTVGMIPFAGSTGAPSVGAFGVALDDNVNEDAISSGFIVPSDFISNMVITAVVEAVNAGDAFLINQASYNTCGEVIDTTQDVNAGGAIAVAITGAGTYDCIIPVTLSTPALNDFVRMLILRQGANVLDTLIGDLIVCNWQIEYFGWKK